MLEYILQSARRKSNIIKRLPVLALIGASVCGCVLVPEQGQFLCETREDCPPGWGCYQGACYDDEQLPSDSADEEAVTDNDTIQDDDTAGDKGTDSDTASELGTDATTDEDTGPSSDLDTSDSEPDTETVADTATPVETDTFIDSETTVDSETAADSDTFADTDTGTGGYPECIPGSGPCCNHLGKYYSLADNHVCGDELRQYRCEAETCKAYLQHRTGFRRCPGGTVKCADEMREEDWTDWINDQKCKNDELCQNGATLYDFAYCIVHPSC